MKVLINFLISICLVQVCFISLALSQEEYIAFDLYLGDDFKGLLPVYYTENTARIENPADLLKLTGLDENDPQMLELVSGVIPFVNKKEGVGEININPKAFRVVLIPDVKFLKLKSTTKAGLLEITADKSSFRTDLQAFHFDTANSGEVQQYRILNNLSYKKTWLQSDLEFVQGETGEDRINDASLNFVLGRFINSAGFLQSTGRQLTPTANILGVTIRSEPLLYSGSDDLRGSIFEIYVPTRSRVEFYRNGVLINTQVLPSGHQEVDTARFPQGSYYVDIVITGLGGVSRERRFFAKSGFLTTRGAPQYRLDLGELRDNEQTLGIPFYQASAEFRLFNFLQLNLSSFGTDEKQTQVAGFNAIYDDFLLTGAASTSSNGKTSLAIGGGGQILGFAISGDYEKSEQVSIDELERLDFDGDLDSVEEPFLNEKLGSEGERYTLTVGRWFDNLEIRYNYSFISADPDPTSDDPTDFDSYGPTFRYRFLEDIKNSVYLELSALKTNNLDNYLAILSWQHRFAPWSTDFSAGARKNDKKTSPIVRPIVQYDTLVQRSGIGVRGRVEGLYQETEESSQRSNSLDLRSGSKYGGLIVLANDSKSSDSSESSFGVGGNISIVKGSNGGVATGPSGLGQSLLVVELENIDNQAQTDILIDGQSINKIQGSGRFILGVSPYQKFNIRIRPSEASTLTRYDSSTRKIILLPGSVQTEKFKIEKVFLAVGRIIDAQGNPIALKRVHGLSEYPLTEANGYFQAEVVGNEDLKVELSSEKFCKIELPKVEKVEYFYEFGDLVCR